MFLDLKKVFDAVSHSILLGKLSHYGIRGQAHNLLSSYLEDRKQYVRNYDITSTTESIEYGVPQGSTLGPLLFLIYINDIVNSTSSLPRLFADDTIVSKSTQTHFQTLNSSLIRNLKNFRMGQCKSTNC